MIGAGGQIRLLRSRVALVGLGGLGGTIFEMLLRLGVGHISIADGDCFEESNLNRQLLSSRAGIGRAKTEEAVARAALINSAVEITFLTERIGEGQADKLLESCGLAFDALDSIGARFILQAACRKLGIPMIHAAVEGWTGQAMTVFPDGQGIEVLYGHERQTVGGTSDPADTLVFGPFLMAAFQVSEAVRILTGRHDGGRRLLICDLDKMVMELADLKSEAGRMA